MVVVTIIEKTKDRRGLLTRMRETALLGGPFADEVAAIQAISAHQQAHPLDPPLTRTTWRSYRIEHAPVQTSESPPPTKRRSKA